jgi:hypothetical protein
MVEIFSVSYSFLSFVFTHKNNKVKKMTKVLSRWSQTTLSFVSSAEVCMVWWWVHIEEHINQGSPRQEENVANHQI